MEDTSVRAGRRYVGYYSEGLVPVVTKNAGVLWLQRNVLENRSQKEMKQPEGNAEGKATMNETTETSRLLVTTKAAQREEQPTKLKMTPVAAGTNEPLSESTVMWLRRTEKNMETSAGRNNFERDVASGQSKCSGPPGAEPSLAASENVLNMAGDWPPLNDPTSSAVTKNTKTGSVDRTTYKDALMLGNGSYTLQNAVNGRAGHPNPKIASNRELSPANSRESNNTSSNEITSDSEVEKQASLARNSVPTTMQPAKGKEPEIATSWKQHLSSDIQDLPPGRCSTPYIGSANAGHVATQYMNRKESLDIINDSTLHTAGSNPLIPCTLGESTPLPMTGGQPATVPHGHYPMDHAPQPIYNHANKPVQNVLRQFNEWGGFGNEPSRPTTSSITRNQVGQSNMENGSGAERSDDLGKLPSEILDNIVSTLEDLKKQDWQRLSITEKLLKQTQLLKQAQMAGAI